MQKLIKLVFSLLSIGSSGVLLLLTKDKAIEALTHFGEILNNGYTLEPIDSFAVKIVCACMLLLTLLLNLATKDTVEGGQDG